MNEKLSECKDTIFFVIQTVPYIASSFHMHASVSSDSRARTKKSILIANFYLCFHRRHQCHAISFCSKLYFFSIGIYHIREHRYNRFSWMRKQNNAEKNKRTKSSLVEHKLEFVHLSNSHPQIKNYNQNSGIAFNLNCVN